MTEIIQCPLCRTNAVIHSNERYIGPNQGYCPNDNCKQILFQLDDPTTTRNLCREDEVPDASRTEYEDVQSRYDEWAVASRQNTTQLHLQACEGVRGERDTSFKRKSIDVFPYGYYPICDFCLHAYRRDNIEQSTLEAIADPPYQVQ